MTQRTQAIGALAIMALLVGAVLLPGAPDMGGAFTTVNSAMIIVREGLEAVLIVGAMLGYVRATKAPRKYTRWVTVGVLTALAATLVTWVAAHTLITLSEASRELIEGLTSLLAVAVLFYVTNWLFRKTYVQDWIRYIQERMGDALGKGSAVAMAGLAFMVVYREGLETVLFYQALLFDAAPFPVFAGFAAGLVVIAIVAYLVLYLSQRIPMKLFFGVTTALLLALAFNFTGAGVHELQEVGWIGETRLPWFPDSPLLKELFGLYPYIETLLAQALFAAAAAVTFTLSRRQIKRQHAASLTAPS